MIEATPAFRVLTARSAVSGPDGLNAINTTPINQGAIVLVGESLFRLDRQSTAVADGVTVIDPLVGPGRWIQLGGAVRDVPFSTTFASGGSTNIALDVSDIVPLDPIQDTVGIFLRMRILAVYMNPTTGAWLDSGLTQLEANLNYQGTTVDGVVAQAGGGANVDESVVVFNTYPEVAIDYGATEVQVLNFTIQDDTAMPPANHLVQIHGYYSLYTKRSART